MMMKKRIVVKLTLLAAVAFAMGPSARAAGLEWQESYAEAYHQAQREKKLMIVAFCPTDRPYSAPAGAEAVLSDCVLVRLTIDSDDQASAAADANSNPEEAKTQSRATELLQAKAFRPLSPSGGLALVNLQYDGAQYGHVLGTLPPSAANSSGRVAALIDGVRRQHGPPIDQDAFGLTWHRDYNTAYRAAKSAGKIMFLAVDSDEYRFTPDLTQADLLRDLVLLRLHVDHNRSLLTHSGMRKFHLAAGIGLIDLRDEQLPDFGKVSQVIPARLVSKPGMRAMLSIARSEEPIQPAVKWHTDYHKARALAERDHKMLLIAIDDDRQTYEPRRHSIPLLHGYVCLRQSIDTQYETRQGPVRRLLKFRDFEPLREQPGIVVYDFTNPKEEHYGEVVSAMPYQYLGPNPGNRVFSAAEREHEFLLLEPNTLTRRTLTWAIRVSKGYGANQRLRSADGAPCDARMDGALRNSILQCSYGVGHHAGGLSGGEIASPGPGQDVVDAALNMVRIWRGSPPHYGMMVRFHHRFGYDMHARSRGRWYGTGRF